MPVGLLAQSLRLFYPSFPPLSPLPTFYFPFSFAIGTPFLPCHNWQCFFLSAPILLFPPFCSFFFFTIPPPSSPGLRSFLHFGLLFACEGKGLFSICFTGLITPLYHRLKLQALSLSRARAPPPPKRVKGFFPSKLIFFSWSCFLLTSYFLPCCCDETGTSFGLFFVTCFPLTLQLLWTVFSSCQDSENPR